jgi:hypothetical protein
MQLFHFDRDTQEEETMAAGPQRRILLVPLTSLVWLACAFSVSAQQTSVVPTALSLVLLTLQ